MFSTAASKILLPSLDSASVAGDLFSLALSSAAKQNPAVSCSNLLDVHDYTTTVTSPFGSNPTCKFVSDSNRTNITFTLGAGHKIVSGM